ncbi:hypothetical protein RhiTH_002676 [Rhizoctonia solani]
MYKKLLVYIVRHGETNENRMGIIQGQIDTQLNEAGRGLKDVNFVKAYSSDSSRAADYMGSLSGTKAPVKRPLPPGVETSESVGARILQFWENSIIPLCSLSDIVLGNTGDLNTDPGAPSLASSPSHSADSEKLHTPAVLIVSHGATISKLVNQIFLRNYGYEVACDMRHGIYNTSITILRMTAIVTMWPPVSDDDRSIVKEGKQSLVSVTGELIAYASISHLIRKKGVVEDNADLLGQGSL